MIRLLAIVVFSFFSATSALSADLDWKWSKADTALQLTWTTMHVLDWSQTRKIAKEPERFWERNSIMGKHPSVDKVDVIFAMSAILDVAIARMLPRPYRTYFQIVSIGATGYCVTINFSIGLGGGDWF